MMFEEEQELQQVWRFVPPTNIYSEDEWLTDAGWALSIGYDILVPSGGIYREDFFRESRANVDVGITVSDATAIVICAKPENASLFVPIYSTTLASGGTYTVQCSFSGLTFYTGLGIIFSTGVSGSVNWIYLGEKTYATKDEQFVDGVWKYVGPIYGRIEPLGAGSSAVRNMQTFADISEADFIPIDYRTFVKSGDGIIDVDGIQRQVVGEPEVYRYMLPHVVLYLKRFQWEVV